MHRAMIRPAVGALAWALAASGASAQTIEPPFDQFYSSVDLGSPSGVPAPLGGLMLERNDPDTLVIGGDANGHVGALYEIGLVRTCGRITGFVGAAAAVSAAPFIDGGVVYHPNGTILYTRYADNEVGQTLPGSSLTDKVVELTAHGVAPSVGACQIVPPGFPGAGQFKVISYSASVWYTVGLAPDGSGTFDVGAVTNPVPVSGGPEGVVYVRAGSPLFPVDSVLISEWDVGTVAAYEIDANGDPIVSTRREFIIGLSGAQGGHVDRRTGDFLFSTVGGGYRVIVVRGFSGACPGDTNDDLRVDFGDLNTILTNYGQSAPGITGDVNHDCIVDFADLNIVLARFGVSCAV